MVPQSYIGQFCREKKAVKERWEKRQEGNLKKKDAKNSWKKIWNEEGKKDARKCAYGSSCVLLSVFVIFLLRLLTI